MRNDRVDIKTPKRKRRYRFKREAPLGIRDLWTCVIPDGRYRGQLLFLAPRRFQEWLATTPGVNARLKRLSRELLAMGVDANQPTSQGFSVRHEAVRA
jgi:hypothetical protein